MNPLCATSRENFSAYLDGAITGHQMQSLGGHLDSCAQCAKEFEGWRGMQNELAEMRVTKAPDDLGLKLRLAISRERARRHANPLDAISLRWQNAIRPMLLQVSAGFAMAVALLVAIGFLFGSVAVPPAVLANDEPLGAVTTPHYRYSADRPLPILTAHDTTIVVEAQLNDQGRVFDYTIVSGPQDPSVQQQVQNHLLLSVFEPASVFGAPVRSRIIVTYAGVSVRG